MVTVMGEGTGRMLVANPMAPSLSRSGRRDGQSWRQRAAVSNAARRLTPLRTYLPPGQFRSTGENMTNFWTSIDVHVETSRELLPHCPTMTRVTADSFPPVRPPQRLPHRGCRQRRARLPEGPRVFRRQRPLAADVVRRARPQAIAPDASRQERRTHCRGCRPGSSSARSRTSGGRLFEDDQGAIPEAPRVDPHAGQRRPEVPAGRDSPVRARPLRSLSGRRRPAR
jgi:hypothetical protein